MRPFHLILGRNTVKLARQTAQRAAQAETGSVYILVPDQYTLTAERFYMDILGENKMRNIRVLSMKRLASDISAAYADAGRALGEAGMRILVKEAYENVKQDMLYYRSCGSIHFIDSLCSQIHELKIYRVPPQALGLDRNEYPSPKIHDIALIYAEYDRLLADGGFTDPGDKLKVMCEEISRRGLFGTDTFFVDFFKVLNASELNVIKTLWLSGAEMTVSLRTFSTRENFDFSAPVASVYRRILKFVEECGEHADQTFLEDPWSDNPVMAFAEKNLFSRTPKAYAEPAPNVSFYRASDPYDEIDRIASCIGRLVRDEGVRYRDIAIVTSDVSSYEAYMDTVFAEYDIPVFYHRKVSLRQKIPVKFISSLLNACINRDAAVHLLEMTRTGLLGVGEEAAADFEEYVYTWGLRYYSHFTRPFVRSIRGFRDVSQDSPEDSAALANAERVRRTLMEITDDFRQKYSRCTVEQMCRGIYALLQRVDMERFLQETSQKYRQHGQSELYSENLQVYRQIISALDELVYTSASKTVDIRDFRDIFIQTADGFKIDIIPTAADEVLAGNADTIPLAGQKYVFVFGLCDGSFPSAPSDGGLINDRDREIFEKADVHIGIHSHDKYLYELFTAYSALTSASEHVSLSYPCVFNGERSPSSVYTDMRRIFCLCPQVLPPSKDEEFGQRVQRAAPALALAARTGFEDLREYFAAGDGEKYFNAPQLPQNLRPATAAALFGRGMNLSATKVDVFFNCKYRYFYKYGLGLRSREQARFDPRNAGTFIHAMFERVMSDVHWMELTDDELARTVRQKADEYFDAILVDGEATAAFGIYKENLARKVSMHLARMREELKGSAFVPRKFELRVAHGGDIEPVRIDVDGGTVRMTGQIDRIDSYEDGGVSYIRVVDYKSGSKKFDLGCVCNGIDVQLLSYMYAIKENGSGLFGRVQPAGVMYESVRQGITDELKGAPDEDSGLYLDDDRIRMAVTGDSGGEFRKGFDTISWDDFDLIFARIQKLLADMGSELLKGNIEKNPLKIGSKVDGCKNCDLRDVCEHCGLYVQIEPKNTEQALKELRGEEDGDGQ